MNVTKVPVQTGLAEEVIAILTGSMGFTVDMTGLEVAGLPDGQVALDVRMHETTSPFAGLYVKAGLLNPDGMLLTIH